MARANNASEVFARLTEAGYIRDQDTPGSTTTDSAFTADGSIDNIDVADASPFSVGDIVRLDTETRLEHHVVEAVDTASTPNNITFESVIAYDHDAGVDVVQAEKIVLGDVTDDGITEDLTVDRTEIDVATQLATYATLVTSVDARLELSIENVNPENYLFSGGVDDAGATGSGTAADPGQAVVDGDSVNSGIADISLYFTGIMDDGDNVEVQGWNAIIDPNRSRTWNTGTGAPLPIAADVSTLVTKIWS